MTTSTALAEDYLARLRDAARTLPAPRRVELVQAIEEHVQAVREETADDPVLLRQALDRLGTPDDIVRETAGPAAPGPGPSLRLELAAVLMLTAGSVVVPVVGWLVGVALLWSSRVWTPAEKALGTLVFPGGLGLVGLLLFALPGQTCSSETGIDEDGVAYSIPETCTGFALPVWLGTPLAIVLIVAPIAVAAILMQRATRRSAHNPA